MRLLEIPKLLEETKDNKTAKVHNNKTSKQFGSLITKATYKKVIYIGGEGWVWGGGGAITLLFYGEAPQVKPISN